MSPFFVAVFSAIKYFEMTEKIKWLVGLFPRNTSLVLKKG